MATDRLPHQRQALKAWESSGDAPELPMQGRSSKQMMSTGEENHGRPRQEISAL